MRSNFVSFPKVFFGIRDLAPGREQLVEVRFASSPATVKRPPVGFKTLSEFSRRSASKPYPVFEW